MFLVAFSRLLFSKRCVRVTETKGDGLQGHWTTEASADAVDVEGGESELGIACGAEKKDANVALGGCRPVGVLLAS